MAAEQEQCDGPAKEKQGADDHDSRPVCRGIRIGGSRPPAGSAKRSRPLLEPGHDVGGHVDRHCEPDPWALCAAAELTPITRPVTSSSGPPLLPGLMDASVWSRPVIVVVRRLPAEPTSIVRPVADRIPDVTNSVNVPSGLPMAITCWPTFSADASPIGIVGSDVGGSTLTTARSCSLSLATTVPGSSEPSLNVTVILSLPSMT